MRIQNNLDYDIAIEFFRLDEESEFPEFITSIFLLPDENDIISPEELGDSDVIALFHTDKGIDIRYLKRNSASFEPANIIAQELLNYFLPADPRERITNNLNVCTDVWHNLPLCVISEKTGC